MPPVLHLKPQTRGAAVAVLLLAGCATGLIVKSDFLTVSEVFLFTQT